MDRLRLFLIFFLFYLAVTACVSCSSYPVKNLGQVVFTCQDLLDKKPTFKTFYDSCLDFTSKKSCPAKAPACLENVKGFCLIVFRDKLYQAIDSCTEAQLEAFKTQPPDLPLPFTPSENFY